MPTVYRQPVPYPRLPRLPPSHTAYNCTHTCVVVVRARSLPTLRLSLRPFSATDQGVPHQTPTPPQFSNSHPPFIIIAIHKTVNGDKSESTPRAELGSPRVGLSFIISTHPSSRLPHAYIVSMSLKRRHGIRFSAPVYTVTLLRSPVGVG